MHLFLLNLMIISIASTAVADITEYNANCTLPPYPAHGTYTASEHGPDVASPGQSGKPGDIVPRAVLVVTCDEGYHRVGREFITCLSGLWSIDIVDFNDTCLPFCKTDTNVAVVSCDANTPKCLLPPNKAPSLGSRTISTDEKCGFVGLEIDHIIAGGSRAGFHESPWHAGLYTKTMKPYMQICGGTLIKRDVVVTAAHCFSRDGTIPPTSNYAIAVGKIYRPWNDDHDKGAQKADVKEIRIPPRYMGSIANFQDDIAMVVTTEEFFLSNYVRPACISFDPKFDDEQLREGNLGRVFGWGLVGENSRSSQVLQFADLPYVGIYKCITESPFSFKGSITSDKFCAGYTNGTSVCRGDSGGGLLFPKYVAGKIRYFLRGLVSTSPSSENACNIFTWATFTHIMKHEAFIKLFMGPAEEEPSDLNVNEPASHFGEYPTYNLDFRIATKKPSTEGWI